MTINNVDRFKAKVARGELCVGTSITFTDPAISELVGDAGYDFTWIDMEHCPIDIATAPGSAGLVFSSSSRKVIVVVATKQVIVVVISTPITASGIFCIHEVILVI